MVRDDASYEIWIRISQRNHQLGQLILVELTDRAEHALPGSGTELSVTHRSSANTDDVFSYKENQSRFKMTPDASEKQNNPRDEREIRITHHPSKFAEQTGPEKPEEAERRFR